MPTSPPIAEPTRHRRIGPASRRAIRAAARVASWLAFAAGVLLMVGWLSLHWLILPDIERWRGPIETHASRLLGAPVRIGRIDVRSGGWVPSIELHDVRVLDADQRVALALPHVVAALSARSLLAFDLRFEQLLIDGASLEVRRDARGHIRVGGIDFGNGVTAGDGDNAAADWFFRQHEFVIRGGSLRWIDEGRAAPPLVLSSVELVIRNGLRSHALRLDATPPVEWGDRFSVSGRFGQPLFSAAGDWHRWSGTVFASLPRADVHELRRHVELPFDLSEGYGALRGWFDVEAGEPRGAAVDLALGAVRMRLDRSVETLDIEQLRGRISARRDDERTVVKAQGLAFVTGDGLRWPSSDIEVGWRQRNGGPVTGGEIASSHLDIGVMAQIAGRLPLGKAVHELLAELRPTGFVNKLATHWEGPLDAPQRYSVKGSLTGLSLASQPQARVDAIGRPGFSNASVELDANESGGGAHLGIAAGTIELPGVLAEPTLKFDRLAARVDWTLGAKVAGAPAPIVVKLTAAQFANADLHGDLSATWRTGPGGTTGRGGRFPGQLDLDGRLGDVDAGRSARYLPLGLPDNVRSYYGRAVRAGTFSSAEVRVRGDLFDFPFHGAKQAATGEFRIDAKLRDFGFAYLPEDGPNPTWPPLTAASGEVVIDHGSLEIRDLKARLAGIDWSGVHGRIAELGDAARLEVEGTARAPLAEMVRVVNATPVGRWTGRALAATTATGPAEMHVALAIPLADASQSTVRGNLALPGNDVRMTADTPLLAGTRARVDFTHKGFTVAAGSARVLGGSLAFEGGSTNGLAGGDGQRFTGSGTLTAEALRHTPELGSISRLGAVITGQTAYRASLAFVAGRPQIQFASNLAGLAIDLPAPLGKAAAVPMPLRVRTAALDVVATARADTAAAPPPPVRETLQVELGRSLRAAFAREGKASGPMVMRGSIRLVEPLGASPSTSPASAAEAGFGDVAEALPLPPEGVHASIDLDRIDVPAWQAAASRLQGEGGTGAGGSGVGVAGVGGSGPVVSGLGAGTSGVAAPLVFDASGGEGYLPDHIALRTRELDLGGRRFSAVTAGMSLMGGLWRANVDADDLDGYLEYRPAKRGGAAAAGLVYARLARLRLPKGEAERVESLLEEPPASIPALDVVVDEFELRGKHLGRLEIEAVNRLSPTGSRDWQLAKLDLTVPEAHLQATGTWAAPPGNGGPRNGPRVAAMNFTLAVADSGALLERLGVGRVVRNGKGTLAGKLAWAGSPLSPNTAHMTGDVKIAIAAGQFLKASPGAARLLGVLSLQSLSRRLLLDFRDLFEDGFAFDDVVGDVMIGGGLATTNNLRMRGAAAAVLMEGSADLERETEDLRVVVVPEINAGTASLAYAVINPAIGLGTFLAQYFLKKPLTAAITREFHVTGPWDDPKVERVERRVASGATPPEPAAPSASTVVR